MKKSKSENFITQVHFDFLPPPCVTVRGTGSATAVDPPVGGCPAVCGPEWITKSTDRSAVHQLPLRAGDLYSLSFLPAVILLRLKTGFLVKGSIHLEALADTNTLYVTKPAP